MIFTDKITFTSIDNTFDQYKLIAVENNDNECGIFIFKLNKVNIKNYIFFKRFVGEYQLESYSVAFHKFNPYIKDLYPNAVGVNDISILKYTGKLLAVDARTPNTYSTLDGGIYCGISKKYNGIKIGENIYVADFSKENQIIKKGAL